MIAVIDYDVGNIKSVINILNRLNQKFILTNSTNEIEPIFVSNALYE